MAFAQALLLAVVGLFCIGSFVQVSSARDVQLVSGPSLMANARTLADMQMGDEEEVDDTPDVNDGTEGDEGNEGCCGGEGDEGAYDDQSDGNTDGGDGNPDGGDGNPDGGDGDPDGGDGNPDGGDGNPDGGDGNPDGGDGDPDGGDGDPDGGDGNPDGGDGNPDGGDGDPDGGDGDPDGGDGNPDGGDGNPDGGDGDPDGGDGDPDGGDGDPDGGDGDPDGGDGDPDGGDGDPDGGDGTEMEEEMPGAEDDEMPGAEDEEMPEEEMTPEDMPDETPEEEDDGGAGAAAAAGGAAAAGAVGAGAAAAATAGGDAPEGADAPEVTPGDALAPAPAGTRDFDFADGPAQCTTLRDGLMNASPILQTALDAIAPEGDPSTLGMALDDPSVNVTVLLPDEETLQLVATALTTDTTGTINAELVQEILLDHILAEPLEAAELIELGDGPVLLVTGEEIELMIDGSDVLFTLNNITAMVTTPDLDGCAGESVIHRIDGIFAELPTVEETTRGTADPGEVDETAEEGAAPFLSAIAPTAIIALASAVMLL